MELLSAALRHVRDAEHLASVAPPARSLDQAYHLAGFGPECARKATLPIDAFNKAIGHGFEGTSELMLDFALAIVPRTTRYDVGDTAEVGELRRWSPQVRYDATGTHANPTALIEEARIFVDRVVFALWADGELSEPFSW